MTAFYSLADCFLNSTVQKLYGKFMVFKAFERFKALGGRLDA
jgi:hypothetical protein